MDVEINPPSLESNMKQEDAGSVTTFENAEMDAAKIMMSRFDSNITHAKGGQDEDVNGDEMMLSHSVGCLLYDILVQGNETYQIMNNSEPPQKKRRGNSLSDLASNLVSARSDFFAKYIPLLELGFSSSLHLLIDGLIKVCIIYLQFVNLYHYHYLMTILLCPH